MGAKNITHTHNVSGFGEIGFSAARARAHACLNSERHANITCDALLSTSNISSRHTMLSHVLVAWQQQLQT